MPRTLPWLKDASSNAKSVPAQARPAKRQRISDGAAHIGSTPNSSGFVSKDASSPHSGQMRSTTSLSKGSKQPENLASAEHNNLTSSSPPPIDEEAEGGDVEYMREGLDADDIYVMVEDEFYDIAKTFTAHLHQAEYVRQRRLAQERNAKGAAAILSASAARKPSEIKVFSGGQRPAEKRGKSKVGGLLNDTEMSSADESEVEVKITHATTRRKRVIAGAEIGLQRLMGSPSKAHRSLMGLHSPSIKSRAAAGFKQCLGTPPKDSRYGDRSSELSTPKSSRHVERSSEISTPKATWPSGDDDSTTASEEDLEDDLDVTPRASRASKVGQVDSNSGMSLGRSLFSRDTTVAAKQHESGVQFESSRDHQQQKDDGRLEDSMDLPAAFDGFLRPTPLPAPRSRREKAKELE